LSQDVTAQVWGNPPLKGERAVANADEDSITMAVEAAVDCLNGVERESIDGLYFASTTPPYREKLSASIVAAACDLREDIFVADFTDSVRSGTMAMKAAFDAVTAGTARKVLVVASDCRIPPPNSDFEPFLGDGAAALLIGDANIMASVEGSYSLCSEFIDVWKMEGDRVIRTWEDRFIREEGYVKYLSRVVFELLKRCDLTPKDFSKALFYAPDSRSHTAMARSLGFDVKQQVQDPMFNTVGNTGTAFSLMMLVAALEEANPGERSLLANYGDGADAYILRITGEIRSVKDRRGIKRHLASKLMLDNYGKYIKFRNLMEFAPSLEYEMRTSLPMIDRDRDWVYRLHGCKCKSCGQVQYPKHRICMYCQTRENFEDISLLGAKGKLFTFSMDERAPVVDPPNVLAVTDLELKEGKCRFYGQMTDRDTTKIEVGMPIELTFRKMHDSLGVRNYFWKCRPVRE
jgi:3-hydroxy-3-methylglutaryl CoA synthase